MEYINYYNHFYNSYLISRIFVVYHLLIIFTRLKFELVDIDLPSVFFVLFDVLESESTIVSIVVLRLFLTNGNIVYFTSFFITSTCNICVLPL